MISTIDFGSISSSLNLDETTLNKKIMTPVLDLIVSDACSFAGTDFSKYEDRIKKAIEEGHDPVVILYFHGVVEDKLGYDIGACLNGEYIRNDKSYKEGIYKAKVDGYPNELLAFLWNAKGDPRGLIVDSTSKEDVDYAQSKFDKKERYL